MEEKLIELLLDVDDVCDASDCVECDRINCFIHRAADHLIANGVVVQRWIPVTERMPEHGEVCECYTVYKGVNMMQWDGVAERWLGERLIYKNDVVTHWMPLPEPPKEGE